MAFWEKEMAALAAEGGRVPEYMDYLRHSLPLCDLHSYPFELFLEFARHADMVRREAAWLADVPDAMFLSYVLMPRVNDEDLSGHRLLFYRELCDRLKGLSDNDAALAVNVWCAEHVVYKAQDARTASPLTVYRSGEGRCGEESAFLVAALRSVGIPARQVYAPWWSHCDDNHAWTEVYCGGEWRFMGACEPEPVLDRGWFNAAASRAMYVHSRDFRDHRVVFHNETRRYAATKEYPLGLPVGTGYYIEVLNQAMFLPVATGTASDSPEALELGLGDFRLTTTGDINPTGVWLDFDFNPAPDTAVIPPLTKAQEEQKALCLAECAVKRGKWTNGFCNADAINSFLAMGNEPQRKALLDTLREKDFRDVTAAVLEDHFQAALPFLPHYPTNIYIEALLAPRISDERLTPWRSVLAESLGRELLTDIRRNPGIAKAWIDENVTVDNADRVNHLIWTPDIAIKSRLCNRRSLPVLLIAVLRTAGLPARLNPVDRRPEYWMGTDFVPVTPEPMGTLTLTKSGQLIYGVNWSLARYENNENSLWRALRPNEDWHDGTLSMSIRTGRYRIITATRQNDGGQRASEIYFDVNADKETLVTLKLRDSGKTVAGPVTLKFWLDNGGEPTEHIVNELLAYRKEIIAAGADVYVYVKNNDDPCHAAAALLSGWPGIELLNGEAPKWPSFEASRDGVILLEGSGYRAGVVAAMAAL